MKYILKQHMLCICALYSKRQQIKFFEKIFDRCARSPASFKIIASPRQRRHCKKDFGAKTAFQTQASAKLAQTFESCLSGVW